MSRIAKTPIILPKSVEAKIVGSEITVKGIKGSISINLHTIVQVQIEEGYIKIISDKTNKFANSLAGTSRAIINNMVVGVSIGYEKKLNLVGVGYRAQGKEDILALSLGFSHPIEYRIPIGIVIETPSQTEILVKGCDKQIVGQVAANIRAFRPPEPYKGKGIRYSNEVIIRKEAKKK
ncbi:MAG: 50S ribosomal protein L6 [Proteobacteria bacterium]|nr:50S ribosomal protein L6 [Pseudomonadota bacterium]